MLIPLIFWFSLMAGLVLATLVVGLKEKKVAQKARASMAPQPLGDDPAMGADMAVDEGFGGDDFAADEGFGEVDTFGEVEELK
jgi:hypothetical protein